MKGAFAGLFPADTRFLVTGGAGFIGSNLAEALLDAGYAVRCLDDFSTGKRDNIKPFEGHPRFELQEGDIRDADTCLTACRGVDYVCHQAAWGSVPRSIKLPLLYEQVNIHGTLNMLEAARQQGVKAFVYASSSSVYGDEPALPKAEGKEGKALSPYALTKQVNEDYARLYTSLYGLPTIGLRYFNVFGRRQDPDGAYAAVIPKFIKALAQGQPCLINGDGSQSRDFTYIDNVIQANIRACLAPEAAWGRAFNIACGGRVTLLALYAALAKAMGKPDTPPQFGPPRAGDIPHSHADISQARALLHYEPQHDFESGLALAIAWYREHLT